MSKELIFSIEVSLCEGCSRVHLELFLPEGDCFSLPLEDHQWEDLLVRYAKMKRQRDRRIETVN